MNIIFTILSPRRMPTLLAGAALFTALVKPAQAVMIIDNFAPNAVVSAQVLSDNTANGLAVQASYTQAANAVMIGGQRDVSISLLGTGTLTNSSTNVMFTNNGAQLGLGPRGSSAQVEFSYSNLLFNAAASGSYIALQQVMNHMPSGTSSPINTLAKSIEVGQRATLTLTDIDGQVASLEKPINYWGSATTPRVENGRFDVVFGFADLLSINGLLNFSLIDSISLRFDLLNNSGFSEVVYLGDGSKSALILGGEAFPFSPVVGVGVPERGSWVLLPACMAALAMIVRRFKRA